MDADVSLSVVNNYQHVSFTDVEEAFRGGTVTSTVTFRTPEGPYGFFEWLIPAGAMLIYSAAFLKKLGEKHAERVDEGLAHGLRKLWEKAFRPNAPINWRIIDAHGNVKGEPFSAAVKGTATLRDGRTIFLLYRNDISEKDFVRANAAFAKEVAKHLASQGRDRLTRALAQIPPERVPPPYYAVVHFNSQTSDLEVIDYVGSSMESRLVAHQLKSRARATKRTTGTKKRATSKRKRKR